MWKHYYTVSSIDDALNILDGEREQAKIIAGGTDLVLELKNGAHSQVNTLIDITRIKGKDKVWVDSENFVNIGPLTTHSQCLISPELQQFAVPLVQAARTVGAPQIRNIGTVIGNLVTASPANDTITPLIALDAEVFIRSKQRERSVKLSEFYTGVRLTVLEPNEMVVGIGFSKMSANQKGMFVKYLLRETHAISVTNICAILSFEKNNVTSAAITLGAVAPTIVHAPKAEKFVKGKDLSQEVIEKTSEFAGDDAVPISDIRSSEQYRSHLVPVLVKQALEAINNGTWNDVECEPVLLWGKNKNFMIPIDKTIEHDSTQPISSKINGKVKTFTSGQNHTLLSLVRDQAHLTGSKLGCGEGECGACTLYLNGLPVLSCLVPAPKAHNYEVTTIEGLSVNGKLHPVQDAFIDAGAIQCGYCTPGFIMSAVKLLEEKPQPTEIEIKQGLEGNLCRCTGYYSIIEAVDKAAKNNKKKQ